MLGVESAHGPVDGRLAELVALARDHGGSPAERSWASGGSPPGDSAAATWRSAFLRMPYIRDGLARMSEISETFETACTWDRFPALYEAVHREVGAAVKKVTGASGLVNCRFTHIYPDGPPPCFTVIAPGRRGAEVAMWDEIKAAAMETLGEQGATVTHHHAVGRGHRPGYDRQRPEPFALALRAAKQALDPAGILNPGCRSTPRRCDGRRWLGRGCQRGVDPGELLVQALQPHLQVHRQGRRRAAVRRSPSPYGLRGATDEQDGDAVHLRDRPRAVVRAQAAEASVASAGERRPNRGR